MSDFPEINNQRMKQRQDEIIGMFLLGMAFLCVGAMIVGIIMLLSLMYA